MKLYHPADSFDDMTWFDETMWYDEMKWYDELSWYERKLCGPLRNFHARVSRRLDSRKSNSVTDRGQLGKAGGGGGKRNPSLPKNKKCQSTQHNIAQLNTTKWTSVRHFFLLSSARCLHYLLRMSALGSWRKFDFFWSCLEPVEVMYTDK